MAMRGQRSRVRNRVRSGDPNRAIEVTRMSPGRDVLPRDAAGPRRGRPASELCLQILDLPGARAELLISGALADPGKRPADGLRATARDARRDQCVQRL